MSFSKALLKIVSEFEERPIPTTPAEYVDNIALTCDVVANLLEAFAESYDSYPLELEEYLYIADNAVCDLVAVLQRASLEKDSLPMLYDDPLKKEKLND